MKKILVFIIAILSFAGQAQDNPQVTVEEAARESFPNPTNGIGSFKYNKTDYPLGYVVYKYDFVNSALVFYPENPELGQPAYSIVFYIDNFEDGTYTIGKESDGWDVSSAYYEIATDYYNSTYTAESGTLTVSTDDNYDYLFSFQLKLHNGKKLKGSFIGGCETTYCETTYEYDVAVEEELTNMDLSDFEIGKEELESAKREYPGMFRINNHHYPIRRVVASEQETQVILAFMSDTLFYHNDETLRDNLVWIVQLPKDSAGNITEEILFHNYYDNPNYFTHLEFIHNQKGETNKFSDWNNAVCITKKRDGQYQFEFKFITFSEETVYGYFTGQIDTSLKIPQDYLPSWYDDDDEWLTETYSDPYIHQFDLEQVTLQNSLIKNEEPAVPMPYGYFMTFNEYLFILFLMDQPLESDVWFSHFQAFMFMFMENDTIQEGVFSTSRQEEDVVSAYLSLQNSDINIVRATSSKIAIESVPEGWKINTVSIMPTDTIISNFTGNLVKIDSDSLIPLLKNKVLKLIGNNKGSVQYDKKNTDLAIALRLAILHEVNNVCIISDKNLFSKESNFNAVALTFVPVNGDIPTGTFKFDKKDKTVPYPFSELDFVSGSFISITSDISASKGTLTIAKTGEDHYDITFKGRTENRKKLNISFSGNILYRKIALDDSF